MSGFYLLSTNNKLEKQAATAAELIMGLAMSPHGIGGHDVCGSSTVSCRAVCNMWLSGHNTMRNVRDAMLRRKLLFFEHPTVFAWMLSQDIERLTNKAKSIGKVPILRPNIGSDLDFSDLARENPELTLYDYSKVKSRILDKNWPKNYQLTYSINEKTHWKTARSYLEHGRNCAVVFDTAYSPSHHIVGRLPKWHTIGGKRFPVVDGDIHDRRLAKYDGNGVVVGLRFKGGRKRMQSAQFRGFVKAAGRSRGLIPWKTWKELTA